MPQAWANAPSGAYGGSGWKILAYRADGALGEVSLEAGLEPRQIVPGSTEGQGGAHVHAKQPAPHRSLMIGAVALDRSPPYSGRYAGSAGERLRKPRESPARAPPPQAPTRRGRAAAGRGHRQRDDLVGPDGWIVTPPVRPRCHRGCRCLDSRSVRRMRPPLGPRACGCQRHPIAGARACERRTSTRATTAR